MFGKDLKLRARRVCVCPVENGIYSAPDGLFGGKTVSLEVRNSRTGAAVGYIISDEAPDGNGNVRFYCETFENDRNYGYMTQALNAFCSYLFTQKGVYYIVAEKQTDEFAVKLLDRAGFTESDGVLVLQRTVLGYISIFTCVSVIAGFILGYITGRVPESLVIFVVIGIVAGIVTETVLKKKIPEFRK